MSILFHSFQNHETIYKLKFKNMKKLGVIKMESIKGSRFCIDMGSGFALLGGGIGVLVGLGSWIVCSLSRENS
ncbi:hypothetical protein [Chryseobacterium sp. MEBOG07]|uniref:hypothetical protein n=1 Tax=Chryseobacterium sp. MEBOG07 TaxID=2879939 RepID=UPI001F225E5A|nr:hypothetical protein [Chryseobacterium sp. MEBOG07]UKB78617.1 hypothetical protein LF886_19440 [Chryseobacterium sp. MEBOG07]